MGSAFFVRFALHLIHGLVCHAEVFIVFEIVAGVDDNITHADAEFKRIVQVFGYAAGLLDYAVLDGILRADRSKYQIL